MDNHVKTFLYVEAFAGELRDDTARRAERAGVNHFLHNGKLYRLTNYELVADVGFGVF